MADLSPQLDEAARLLSGGQAEAARRTLQRVLRQAPGDRRANTLMKHVCTRLGEPEQAIYYAQRALRTGPAEPELMSLHAHALLEAGRLPEATAAAEAAAAAHPDHPVLVAFLANLYGSSNRFHDAIERCRGLIDRGIADPRLSGVYAAALVQVGLADDAVEHLTPAVRRWPRDIALVGLLCGAHNYAERSTPEAAVEAQRAYGRAVGSIAPGPRDAHALAFDPEKRLRVGFVGADFRAHAAMFFLEPLLERHDRERLEIFLYSTGLRDDAVTERLRSHPVTWRAAAGLPHAELAAAVRADRVDVLIDLAGHTQGTGLPAFHLRPAPVQMSYLGYPAGTGLPAIEWRLTDEASDPPGTEHLQTGRPLRIETCAWPYRPPASAPAVDPEPPCRRAGGAGVTFGSFSSQPKLTDRTLRLWARVLAATPGSRLLLKNFGLTQERVREHVLERLRAAGAPEGSATLEGPAPSAVELLSHYNRVDVSLDTTPYVGMTTVCEATHMGVPVVSLIGRTAASRATASLLPHVGLADLVVESEEAYIATAVSLARDPARLADLRASLRERLERSALRDEPGFCRRFEAALRAAWREACERRRK